MTDHFEIIPLDATGLNNRVTGLDGFEDDTQLAQTVMQTIFVTAPTQDSEGRCMYFITDDGGKAWLPSVITKVWVTDLSVRTQTYTDPNLEAQDKLICQFVTSSGEYWNLRVGMTSWAGSSLLIGLLHLTQQQLVEQLSFKVTNKGRACFINVRVPDDDLGWRRVEIPREQLRKLSYDESLEAITRINQTAQSIAAPEPALPAAEVFEDEAAADPDAVTEDKLDELIDSIQQPKRRRRKTAATKADTPVTA